VRACAGGETASRDPTAADYGVTTGEAHRAGAVVGSAKPAAAARGKTTAQSAAAARGKSAGKGPAASAAKPAAATSNSTAKVPAVAAAAH
jgi:hypothetical protein